MHRLIREDEVEEVFEGFAREHAGHLAKTEVSEGEWALAFHCEACKTWETFEVDNDARRASLALKYRGSEAEIEAVS